jgi:hypothetical protein
MARSAFVLVLISLLQVPPLRAQARAEDVAAILARMRKAAGISAFARIKDDVLIAGKATRYESFGPFTLRFAPSGKFLQNLGGPLGETFGYDGATYWTVGLSGVFRTLELFDRDSEQLWFALSTGYWLANPAGDGIALAKEGSDPNQVILEIRQGRMKARLYVSRATWLPVMLKRPDTSGGETWSYSNYRDDLGWKLPGKISVDLGGGGHELYEVNSVVAAPSTSAAVYDPPKNRPTDTRFNPAISGALEVTRSVTGHVLVHPKIDGLDLGWLIFDTGAGESTILDPSAVAKLKLTPLGSSSITSFLGPTRSRIMRGASLEIGPMTVANPILVEMDLKFIRDAMGPQVVGIIGYDLFSRCVAEITLAENAVKIYDPARYPNEGLPWQKLTLNKRMPLVPATFEGERNGLFCIDVGASGGVFSNVAFHASAVHDMQLLKGRKLTQTKLGERRMAYGKIAWFNLAGHRFENRNAVFALDPEGVFSDPYVEGNLGVEFLKPFRIVLDYTRDRAAFVPLKQ